MGRFGNSYDFFEIIVINFYASTFACLGVLWGFRREEGTEKLRIERLQQEDMSPC
jgi:hypothetical protein